MFRPMRRFKQQLSQEECISILKSEVRFQSLEMMIIPMVFR